MYTSLVSALSYITAIKQTLSATNSSSNTIVDRVKEDPSTAIKGGLVSITEEISPLLIDPRVVISTDLRGIPEIENILYILNDTFAVYYLQAFTMISDIVDIRTKKVLKSLSSIKRDNTSKLGPIVLEDMSLMGDEFALEAKKEISDVKGRQNKEFSSYNLVKVLDVSVTVTDKKDKDSTITIPVTIRLNPVYVPNDVLDGILGASKARHSLMNRLDDLRSGNISFVKDFLLNMDLRKEHQRLLMKDPTGMYYEVSTKVNKAIRNYATQGVKGYGAFYNMAIISEDDAKRMETALGGSFTKKRIRDKLFARNYVTIMAVVDREWERVTFYTRDIDAFGTISFEMLKDKKASNDRDMMSLLQSVSKNGVVF